MTEPGDVVWVIVRKNGKYQYRAAGYFVRSKRRRTGETVYVVNVNGKEREFDEVRPPGIPRGAPGGDQPAPSRRVRRVGAGIRGT